MINGSYILLFPVCAGISSAVSLPTMKRWELITAFPDAGLRALVWPFVVVATVFSLVHVATLAAVIAVGYLRGLPGHPNVLPVVPVIVGYFCSSALGILVARKAPSLMAAPFCVVALYLLEIFLPRVSPRPFSDFGGATSVLLGLQNRLDVILGQAAFLTALTLALIATSVLGRRLARFSRVGLPLALLLVVSGAFLATRGDHRFREASVEFVCDRTASPEVCVTREYRNELEFYSERIRQLHTELEQLGLSTLPRTYKQAVGADVPAGGRFTTSSDSLPEQTAFEVLQSGFPCSMEWDVREFTRAELIIGYLLKGEGGRLYPGAPKASRSAAVTGLEALACAR